MATDSSVSKSIGKGDTVLVCSRRLGLVEDIMSYCVSGVVSGYYVRWLRKDGSPSKQTSWCDPSNVVKVC